ncbi:MAG: hypothetical protein GX891_02530, partial [Clostridiales bacterium]|nr:hypothetical protein [Clostridiales bacterium]
MKKFTLFLLCFLMSLSLLIGFTACNDDNYLELKTVVDVKQVGESLSVEVSLNENSSAILGNIENVSYKIYKGTNDDKNNLISEITVNDMSEPFTFSVPNYGKYFVKASFAGQDGFYAGQLEIKAQTYEIAYLNGTMPVSMFMSKHVTAEKDHPTFVYLERKQTFDWDALPENTYRIGGVNEDTNKWSFHDDIAIAKAFIKELYDMDNNAKFIINVVDNYTNLIVAFMYENGIPESNFEAVIWTDGTGTNGFIVNNNKTKADYDKNLEELNFYIEKALAGEKVVVGEGDNAREVEPYIAMNKTQSKGSESSKYSFAFTSKSNVTYIVNSTENYYPNNAEMQTLLDESVTVEPLSAMLENLQKDEKAFE